MTVTPEQLIRTIEARLVPLRAQVQRHLLAMVRDQPLAAEITVSEADPQAPPPTAKKGES